MKITARCAKSHPNSYCARRLAPFGYAAAPIDVGYGHVIWSRHLPSASMLGAIVGPAVGVVVVGDVVGDAVGEMLGEGVVGDCVGDVVEVAYWLQAWP